MSKKLIDYLMTKPRHIIWRWLLGSMLAFWLLLVFGVVFIFH